MNKRFLYLPLCCLISTPLLGFKGYTHLQDKRYDEVTFAASHNAQSNLPPTKETLIPLQNQVATISEQLNAGIRAMKLPIFWQDEQVIATHGINEGVKSQVKKLVDTKLDELITQKIDAAAQDNGLQQKITSALKTLKDAESKVAELSNKKIYGRKVPVPQWAKDAVTTAKNALSSLESDKETLGTTIKNELIKNAEEPLKSIFSEKVLNIYYHRDRVKPSDLDPAGRPLVSILREIKTFMDTNPTEIVTLFLEVYGILSKEPQKILDVFKAANLENRLYVQDPSLAWPTLKELTAQKKNFIVFVDVAVDTKKYPFNVFSTFVWSSAYDFSTVDLLKNDTGSDKQPKTEWLNKNNKLFVLQHFITNPIAGDITKAPEVNKKSVIVNRAQRYMENLNLPKPNFIWVDFFATAPLADNLKNIVARIPMMLSLDELKSGNWPKLDPSQLKKQTDVFDAVDELNSMPAATNVLGA